MVGIISYGAYVPLYRLSRADIAKAWGGSAEPGEKAVANFDEDSLTMAVAAAMDCITGIDARNIDGLYFASTTSPYKEKQAAATIATVLDLSGNTFTADFGDSLRGGTNAMRAALDAINGGSANSVLVCAADTRLGYPNGPNEMSFGDGAVALLIGNSGAAATIEGTYTMYDEIIDVWRADKDIFVRSWEDRFLREQGYGRVVPKAISATLKKYGLTPKDFSKFVCHALGPRQLSTLAKAPGFDLKNQVQDTLYSTVGNTGTASSLMSLVAALEEAKAGDRILLAGYGNGCDVFILSVTEEIDKITRAGDRRGIKGHLASKLMVPNYESYLRWRELVQTQPPARPPFEQHSPVALWRDNKGGLALYGAKCKHCGFIQYPAQQVCINCRAKDEFELYRFADKVGKVFTFSHDYITPSPNPPTTICAVDFPEGGRIMTDITDCNPEDIKVGMPVEMTFRKMRYVGGIYNYWWKCRPIRG